MNPHDSFAELEPRLRAGDQDAATDIEKRYAYRLIALARAELDPRLRRKEDPEDVVQSVLRSFLIRYRAGKCDLANWDKLWSLLTVITKRKCLNRARHYFAKIRDVRRESEASLSSDSADGPSEPIDSGPAPIDPVLLRETVEHVMRRMKPADRQITVLILQGYTPQELSQELDISESKVKRVRHCVEDLLTRMQARETDAP
jgi:RNA polymerase sigma-70 factor, ECF subfamily